MKTSPWPMLVLVWLSACTVEAAVFSGSGASGGAGASGSSSGGAGAGGVEVDAGVYGCGAAMRDGPGVLADIVARLGGDLLADNDCATDSECLRTVTRPRCDTSRNMCTFCADPLAQTEFGLRLGACLTAASQTCCQDPGAPPDCIVRACPIGCGER